MSSGTPEHDYEPPVVRDKRRIDPTTGEVRPEAEVPPVPQPEAAGPGGTPADAGGPVADVAPGSAELEAALAERTADLQRVSAEYANYRRRVDRDREAVRELALIAALTELLPVLDNIGRARAHEELVGGFKVVAESLEASLGKLGLVPFGEAGEPFDPNVHEALIHEHSAEVAEATCVEVLQPGYRVGERLVRPARVKVADPAG
ncbi:MAG: nucleotide exchange factor GrpE [Sporichthyaceae bacterium]